MDILNLINIFTDDFDTGILTNVEYKNSYGELCFSNFCLFEIERRWDGYGKHKGNLILRLWDTIDGSGYMDEYLISISESYTFTSSDIEYYYKYNMPICLRSVTFENYIFTECPIYK